jgi:hypothetical protein
LLRQGWNNFELQAYFFPVKKNKNTTSSKRRTKKTSAKESLLHHLERKYTANLEPGSGKSSLREKDEPVINPNK